MVEASRRSLLAVLAHPDDETFGCGGVLAKYAAEGVDVALICATRGEVGEIGGSSTATRENLAEVREGELRAACDALGVSQLFMLDYRDSGMAGSPENEHPLALCQAVQVELVGKVVEIIRKTRPQVVVTFDPRGGYGHPDHIKIHHAAREAFSSAGDNSKYRQQLADSLAPHISDKLYYCVFPRSLARAFQDALIAANIESDFKDMDLADFGTPDAEITTVIDVSKYAAKKEKAALAHHTQVGDEAFFPWMPEALKLQFLSTEHLVRAEPPFDPDHHVLDTDLFAGI